MVMLQLTCVMVVVVVDNVERSLAEGELLSLLWC
jgi:hypothetical protein